jgi:uncharacterized protein
MTSRYARLLVLASFAALVAFVSSLAANAHPPDAVRLRYTKHDYRIRMRDGVTLFTSVYVPRDASRTYPFLFYRTPYGVAPYGPDQYPRRLGPADAFDRAGYIFVFQDVRGRYQSGGTFVDMRPHIDHPTSGATDESTDTYDTVEWLLRNVPRHNGNVGIWGLSYPGFYASAGIIDSHPAIKAASPQAPAINLFAGDDAYHGGAFMLTAQFEFYSTFFKPRLGAAELPPESWPEFRYGTGDGYQYFLRHGPALTDVAATIRNPFFDDHVTHSANDAYWQPRDISQHMTGIHCAVLTVAGWFDAEDLAGPLRAYHAVERNNPGIFNVLVAGPWAHGDWVRRPATGEDVQSRAAEYYREHIAFPFFEHFLKNEADPHLSEAEVFETGSNVWRQYDTWPPANTEERKIYLRANGKLSFEPPGAGEPAYDEYVSDPANPVPYVPYPTTEIASEYMFGDQRFAARRPDVLTYVSDPLETDVTMAGPVSPRLHVSTSGTDSDFDVKLIDVFPGNSSVGTSTTPQETQRLNLPLPTEMTRGYQQLLRGEPMRARFRNSWSRAEPMPRNQVTPLAFDMPDVNHTFLRGHRIMVQIQSSWFPLTDLNPQTFLEIDAAKSQDFVKATERVYHSPKASSAIVVGIVPRR